MLKFIKIRKVDYEL